jgi:hypothetical protein
MSNLPDFATFCSEVLAEPISPAWATFYRAVEGLPLDEEGVELYRQSTGRDHYEPRAYTEATAICGRRSEKTQTCLKFLLWLILFAGFEKQQRTSWFARLGRHTRLLRIPIIAQDTRVAGDIKRTAESLCLAAPLVSREVVDVTADSVIFRNGIALTVFSATKASVRGLPCPAGLLDEFEFVAIDGADPRELVRQVRPSMIQFGAARRLIKLTTPWRKSGLAYQEFAQRAERPELLVWQASTATMTPRIDAAELERERLTDPVYFAREYLAEFASDDLEALIPAGDIQAAIGSWTEQPPRSGVSYYMALDASGLTGGDRFTFGIAETGTDGTNVVLLRGHRRAPVPQVCDEIADLAKLYGISRIVADQYSFSFLAELMRQRDVTLEQLPFTSRSKPEIFFSLKNSLAQATLKIPNHPEVLRELRALESLRTSGGAYKIGAPRGQHDDFATVLALLAHGAKRSNYEPFFEVFDGRVRYPADPMDINNDFGFEPARQPRVASFGRRH